MKHFNFCLIILFTALSFTNAQSGIQTDQNIPLLSEIKTEPVVNGYSFKLHSRILNEERVVMVSLPGDYNTTDKTYPVMYLTDGQWHFSHTNQAIGMLSGNGQIPRMILVAVQTQQYRDRDLVATRDEQQQLGGGADNFLSFFKNELIPFVEKNYRTYPYRLLGGSSFGGIFTVHAFLSEPELFDAYLAYSPSMWWQNQLLNNKTENFLKKNRNLKKYFYINVANEGLGMGVNALAEIFKKNSPPDFKWKFEEYPEEIHETITYKGTYNGLRFVFSDWRSEPVKFITTGDLLNKNDSVKIAIADSGKYIRYTLDGTVPTPNSNLYTKPFVIKNPAIIKTRTFYGNNIPGNCDSLIINYLPKFNSDIKTTGSINGLNFAYYEGEWDNIPVFENLVPLKIGSTPDFAMSERNNDENFALQYTGYFYVPEDDVYTFYLKSDDGSRLLIDDKIIIDNDGLHAALEKNRKVYMHKGLYNFEIQFLQRGGGFELGLEYESEKIEKTKIPDTSFYREK